MKTKVMALSGALLMAAWITPGAGNAQMSETNRSDNHAVTARHGMMTNVKEVQQALKEQGYDPGPVDGAMGMRTKNALKSFQTASNLTPTGTINAETAEKLGVKSNSSPSSSRSGAGSTAGDNMKSSDTTSGKDTDQPNQTPSKNK